MEEKIIKILDNWKKRNIEGVYCPDKVAAQEKIISLIPETSSVGISGSKTLDELGVVSELETRGSLVYNQYKQGLSRDESLMLRNKGAQADFFLSSANAVAESGELIFLSAFGHRIAGIANAKRCILAIGKNKITSDLNLAFKRARNYATPLNCRRLKYASACAEDSVCHYDQCLPSDYKRMCCQLLVIEAEISPGRLTAIIVGEELGF